jgi:hypothetical protein
MRATITSASSVKRICSWSLVVRQDSELPHAVILVDLTRSYALLGVQMTFTMLSGPDGAPYRERAAINEAK